MSSSKVSINIINSIRKKSASFGAEGFSILVGDEGIILLLFNKSGDVEQRIFAKNLQDEENIAAMKNSLVANIRLPVTVIVDSIEQNYLIQNFPPVSKIAIKSIAEKKLNRLFDNTYIKGMLQIYGPDKEHTEWLYIFASMQVTGFLNDILEVIYSVGNPVKKIYFLSVEAANLIKQMLQRSILPEAHTNTKIIMLVLINKVSGIRQIFFRDNKVFFTRLISFDQNEDEEVLAGNINMEIKNSFDYLNRNYSIDPINIPIIGICSENVGRHLKDFSECKDRLFCYSPYEIAQKLEYKSGVLEEDSYADVITILSMKGGMSVLPMSTEYSSKIFQLMILEKALLYLSIIIAAATILYYVSNIINIISINSQITERDSKLSKIEAMIQSRKVQTKVDTKENTLMVESVEIFEDINSVHLSPVNELREFINEARDDVRINSADWRLDGIKVNSKKAVNTKNLNAPASATLMMKLSFINKGSNYQDLFTNFDAFIRKIQNKFKNYSIEYSRINQQINLDNNNQIIPVDLTIRGPIK